MKILSIISLFFVTQISYSSDDSHEEAYYDRHYFVPPRKQRLERWSTFNHKQQKKPTWEGIKDVPPRMQRLETKWVDAEDFVPSFSQSDENTFVSRLIKKTEK